MISSFLRSFPKLGRSWKPLRFSNPNFIRIPATEKLEEETIPSYVASHYYPARIGEIVRDRYQIVGKLGYGVTSTVWLARDFTSRRHVALKIFIHSKFMGAQLDNELDMYKRIKKGSWRHPGKSAVRFLLDSFDVEGPDGQHRCLVHLPLWESIRTFLYRNPVHRLPVPLLALTLKQVFLALDYLHTECKIIHTDIKADNIMFGTLDDSIFTDLEERELQTPSPRKELDGRTIYMSQDLKFPKNLSAPVLCDFGSAVLGDMDHDEDIQPNSYRSPEVILEVPWGYSVDIWNVGCMIWDIFEGGYLFSGHDPELQTYRSRAHLAEMVSLLGPPPPNFLARGKLRAKFFTEKGDFCGGIPLPDPVSLEERETTITVEDREQFLRLIRKMLQWDPEKRNSAKELIEDEWLRKYGP